MKSESTFRILKQVEILSEQTRCTAIPWPTKSSQDFAGVGNFHILSGGLETLQRHNTIHLGTLLDSLLAGSALGTVTWNFSSSRSDGLNATLIPSEVPSFQMSLLPNNTSNLMVNCVCYIIICTKVKSPIIPETNSEQCPEHSQRSISGS